MHYTRCKLTYGSETPTTHIFLLRGKQLARSLLYKPINLRGVDYHWRPLGLRAPAMKAVTDIVPHKDRTMKPARSVKQRGGTYLKHLQPTGLTAFDKLGANKLTRESPHAWHIGKRYLLAGFTISRQRVRPLTLPQFAQCDQREIHVFSIGRSIGADYAAITINNSDGERHQSHQRLQFQFGAVSDQLRVRVRGVPQITSLSSFMCGHSVKLRQNDPISHSRSDWTSCSIRPPRQYVACMSTSFRRTLAQVLTVQIITLILLGLLQSRYTR